MDVGGGGAVLALVGILGLVFLVGGLLFFAGVIGGGGASGGATATDVDAGADAGAGAVGNNNRGENGNDAQENDVPVPAAGGGGGAAGLRQRRGRGAAGAAGGGAAGAAAGGGAAGAAGGGAAGGAGGAGGPAAGGAGAEFARADDGGDDGNDDAAGDGEGAGDGVVAAAGGEREPLDLSGLTKKQMAKAIKKREKEEAKEARKAAVQALVTKKSQKEEEYRRKQAERDAQREAEEQAAEEEARRAEEAEFEKWKGMISIDESGTAAVEEEEAENLLERFVEYITRKKVVVLEELAGHFGLKTEDTIDRVTRLEQSGRISGVIDDRGKFIFITPEELEKVAKFIQKRGRVSQAALAAESNKLIDLNEVEDDAPVDSDGGGVEESKA